MWGKFEGQGPIRLVPESYRGLPLEAKIVYCVHNNVDVWDQQLRYFKRGADIAAVDSKNMPFKDYNFDSNGNLLSYKGVRGNWDATLERIKDPTLRVKAIQDFNQARSEVQKLMEMQNAERKVLKNWDRK